MTLKYENTIPTLNEYINEERGSKYKASAIKRDVTKAIKLITISQTRVKLTGCYDLECHWYRQDKNHDADNVYFGIKFLLDGIVSAGILPGDSRRYVRHIHHYIHSGKNNYVEVIFKEA